MKSFKVILKNFGKVLSKRSPELAIGFGIAGFITATVLAVEATPKAQKKIAKAKEEKGADLTKTETVKAAWKCYIPSAVSIVVSSGLIITANSIHNRRNSALAAAYSISSSTLKTYQDKVIETVGKKKEQDIRDSICEDKIKANPVDKNDIIYTGKGETLCYDAISGRYFRSDIEYLRKVENILNKRLLNEDYISLNDLYWEINLPAIGLGDCMGWNMKDGYIEMSFSSHLANDKDPCLVLDYLVAPRYDYTSCW